MNSRLVLGTVQLGMPYGINNKVGKPSFDNAVKIIKTAFDNGINRFDTSQAYGESEEVLGRSFQELGIKSDVRVYTKLDPKLNLCDRAAVRKSVEDSLLKLKVNQLECIMIHHEEGMDYWDKGLGVILKELITEGKTKSLGASFYTPKKVLEILDVEGVNVFQIPSNILDSRFENFGVFEKAEKLGKDILIRSIFLQGLLLMEPEKVPKTLKAVIPYIEKFRKISAEMNMSHKELAFCCAASMWPNAYIVFGVETPEQVIENIKYSKNVISNDVCKKIFREFSNIDEKLLNPVFWIK
ncbi:MAG: aldo/keto reductase [bacterium]